MKPCLQVGAMLVAPLMTPIMAFASALVQTWSRRVFESFSIVIAGAFLGISVGWLTSMIIPRIGPDTPLPEQVLARTSPNLADLGIALLAGAAGGISNAGDVSRYFPGSFCCLCHIASDFPGGGGLLLHG